MPHRLVFMGSDAIARPALDWLWRDGRATAELVGVFTQLDRPHGRGQKLTPNAIKTWALERGLPVLQPAKLGSDDLAQLRALGPDAVLVMAYGHLLRQDWLDAPPRGFWNLHTSLLPKFRGASPIQGAIAAGEKESGVSLMRLVLKMDAGPVLDVERVAITATETGAMLEEKLAAACVPLVARNLANLFSPAPPLRAQDETQVSFTRRLRKEDGQLDFAAPAAVLARRVNALFPWPGAFFELGGETIRVGLAEAAPDATNSSGARSVGAGANLPAETSAKAGDPAQASARPATVAPGTVVEGAADGLHVAAGDGGVLRLLRLQRPGGRMLPAAEFLRGHAIAPGTVLPSASMPELVAGRPFKG